MLRRVHFLQQWFSLADEAAREALHDIPVYRAFAGIDPGTTGIPDATTVLRFRHLPGRHDLATALLETVNALLEARGQMVRRGTRVDATIVAAPSSTKNRTGTRDPEMHQTRKGNQWLFGMKAHSGVDADSGLVHTVVTTPAKVHDLVVAGDLLHGREVVAHADPGYRSIARWWDTLGVAWQVAMPPGWRRLLATVAGDGCWRQGRPRRWRNGRRPRSARRSGTRSGSSSASSATSRRSTGAWRRTGRSW